VRHLRPALLDAELRLDYRLRKPALQYQVLIHFVSKVTMRQSARTLGTTRKTVEHRLRLLGAHLKLFHQARMAGKQLDGIFQLDEPRPSRPIGASDRSRCPS
jgi:hypothetical protein